MSIEIQWGDERKLYVYSRFHHGWTWKDNAQARMAYIDFMQSVSHRVDAIGDFTDASALPTDLFENIRQLDSKRIPNEGYFIMIGAGDFVRNMYALVRLIVPSIAKYYVLVESMDEALTIIESGREEVDYAMK